MARRYTCSNCGGAGHQARTCPQTPNQRPTIQAAVMPAELTAEHFAPGDKIRVTDGPAREYVGREAVVSRVEYGTVYTDIGGFAIGVWTLEKMVPTSSVPHPAKTAKSLDIWKVIEKTITARNPDGTLAAPFVLLYGPPGTGKTHAAVHAGNPRNVRMVTVTEEMPAAELRGHFVPKGNEFVWHHGCVNASWLDGSRQVINEIDRASGDTLTFLYSAMDDKKMAVQDLPTGDTIRPDNEFGLIATMNGAPEDLPEGLRDRLSVAFYIPTPHPASIKALPNDLQKPAQKSFDGDGASSDIRVSMRQWKLFASLREALDDEHAARAVFGDSADMFLNSLRIAKGA